MSSELLARKGVQETTIEEIAAGAGMSVGTVYFHFGSKEGIVAELVREALSELEASLARIDAPSAIDRVSAVSDEYVRFAITQPMAFRFVSEGSGTDGAATELAEVRREITTRVATLPGRLRAELEAAVAEGEIDLDPETAATLIWATLNGIAALALRQDDLTVDASSIEAALQLSRDTLLRARTSA